MLLEVLDEDVDSLGDVVLAGHYPACCNRAFRPLDG